MQAYSKPLFPKHLVLYPFLPGFSTYILFASTVIPCLSWQQQIHLPLNIFHKHYLPHQAKQNKTEQPTNAFFTTSDMGKIWVRWNKGKLPDRSGQKTTILWEKFMFPLVLLIHIKNVGCILARLSLSWGRERGILVS